MSEKKLAVFGLDCADPVLVFDRFKNELPTLRGLMESGYWGPLRSCDPPITCPAWMVMVTGRSPGELGIYGFRNRSDTTYTGLKIATSLRIKSDTAWDVLGRAGRIRGFGFVGAVLGHLVMGFPLTIISMIGLLGLSGILVNDSIILVSQIDRRRKEGDSLADAAVGASRDRFRAVIGEPVLHAVRVERAALGSCRVQAVRGGHLKEEVVGQGLDAEVAGLLERGEVGPL